uniref:sestrin-3-like n=1 Tax=Styela clava TaxID=7725 RepID=UPI00193AC121|nr:sestrin-3-like [Styela clava]
MSCVTYFESVGPEICKVANNMTAGMPEDDEISALNASYAFLPTYEGTQKQFILLTSQDRATRDLALESLREHTSTLTEYLVEKNGITDVLSRVASPTSNGHKEKCAISSNSANSQEVDLNAFGTPDQVLTHLLKSFLRLSMWCPFDDVRLGCKETLHYFENQGINIPKILVEEPSSFIPHSHIPPVDTDDEQVYSLYVESYAQTCRLEHMVLVMGMHPQYLKEFLSVNMHLLKSDGALPHCYRSYIGILAAARLKCHYLVHLMETDFLMAGGNPEWLRGIEHACPKLQALSTLNKLLAHRPWLITVHHIKELCAGGKGWQWSQSELIQAIVLLCHFHSLAIFCHGTGINLEIDHMQAIDLKNSAILHCISNDVPFDNKGDTENCINGIGETGGENAIEALMQRMQKLQEENYEDVTREEMNRRFEKQKIEAATEIFPSSSTEEDILEDDKSYLLKYIDDADFSYQDFAKRSDSNGIPTFRAMDFNWQDHAYSLVNSYYQPVGDMLDAKFDTAYNLTYNTLATKEHVDTSKLRRAIWMYIHCTCGIMFDDYNYGEVNELLERSLKLFIKTASCYPELTTKPVYDGFWKHFRHSEKVHVNIVLLEGRFQVELLYALRAVTEYIK